MRNRTLLYTVVRLGPESSSTPTVISVYPTPELAEQAIGVYEQECLDKHMQYDNGEIIFQFKVQAAYFYKE